MAQAQHPDWSRSFSGGDEIRADLERCALALEEFDLASRRAR